MTACSLCGGSPPDDDSAGAGAGADEGADEGEVPLGWVSSVENGALRVYCPACAREHLRSIEAKLDSAWW